MNKLFLKVLNSTKVSSISTDIFKQSIMIFILLYEISVDRFVEIKNIV